MKKTLKSLLARIGSASGTAPAPGGEESEMETICREDLASFRGGDKEYKPIYEDTDEQTRRWGKTSTFFEFL